MPDDREIDYTEARVDGRLAYDGLLLKLEEDTVRLPDGSLTRREWVRHPGAVVMIAMGALRQVVPVSQILFGTDYWYRTAAETARGLVTSKVFNENELRMINRGNAERLLPKYKG